MLNSLMVIAQFLTAASTFSYIAESIWEIFSHALFGEFGEGEPACIVQDSAPSCAYERNLFLVFVLYG